MFYHLFYSLSNDFIIFNVVRYITFRSFAAMITALVLSVIFGPYIISFLQRIKCSQPIQDDVVSHKKKDGTPTMGGILIAFGLLLSIFLWADLSNGFIWMTIFVFCGFGFIGFVDDFLKVTRKHNQGLTARVKFLCQFIMSIGAITLLLKIPGYSTNLMVPFFKTITPDLSWGYMIFGVIVLVSSSNAVNLTDGLDGLAIVPAILATICLGGFIYLAGHVDLAQYLQVAYVPGVGEVSVFCGAFVGAGLGFLWFNAYPAQVFMGDVGSLSIGGTIGFLAVLCKQELLLVLIGAVFVVETLSVILQVGYFKFSGRRFFRMAPLHHHFELKGIPESKIIIRCWIISVLCVVLAFASLKLR